MRWFSLILLFHLVFFPEKARSQEIDFGDFFAYAVTVSELIPTEDLDFGLVVTNSGLSSIGISNSKVITITGVRYLDVIVDVSAGSNLVKDTCPTNPACQIPFTLEASFANLGQDNIAQAQMIPITSNTGFAQFPILRRTSGPPGPPPTPVYNGFDPTVFNETAYLYLFGSINVGNVQSGAYSTQITVSVIYD
jgi:hypothetical protein